MKKNTCFVMLAALMMAGCNNEIDEQVMDSRRVPLQINGDINMLMTIGMRRTLSVCIW